MTEQMLRKLQQDVRSCFQANYYSVAEQPVLGVAVSDLKSCLYGGMRGSHHLESRRRWKNLGTTYDFQELLASAGFSMEFGKNRRGQRAEIVFEGGAQ